MTHVRMVVVTAPDLDTAASLIRTLLEEGLIACGNMVDGVRSLYRWEGKICDDAEVLLLLKTVGRTVPRLKERIVELDPYDCPEVLSVPVEEGHDDYLSWVMEQVRS